MTENNRSSSGSPVLDITANRRTSNYSRQEMILRMVWMLVQPMFRYSPRPCFAWRRFLLRTMGATIGDRVHIYPSSQVSLPWMLRIGNDSAVGENVLIYNLGEVTIGCRATISHRAHLCAGTHDYTDKTLPLQRRPIAIGDDAWVCADAFVGPGLSIGDGAVVGACAAVFKNVDPWTVVGGNPASFIKKRILKSEFDQPDIKAGNSNEAG